MTLEQLRIFLAVAEREHVTRAAQALNLTQSATSSAIAALEARHGTQLFERVGRGIRLTEAGRIFLPEARAVLSRSTAAERVLGDVANLSRGNLCLAASQTLATCWMPRLMVQFHAAHPGIHIDLIQGNSDQIVAEVESLRADLGFIEGGAAVPHMIDSVIDEDEVYLVVASHHPWATRPPGPDDLAQGPWIMREKGSGTRALMDEVLAKAGLSPQPALEFPSNEAVRAGILAGGGATLLSRMVVEDDLGLGRLVRLGNLRGKRAFRLIRKPKRHLSAAARAFLRLAAIDDRATDQS